MEKIAYQIYDIETGWTGYYIWTNKENAEYICKQMNEDREKCNLEPTLGIRTVQIV